MTSPSPDVVVVEVGPRDGLQNEPSAVSTAAKVAFIDRLSDAGLPVIEITAFVSPTWVPRMADARDVAEAIARRAGTRYIALVPNEKGLERAMATRLDGISVIAAASETFSQRNTNVSMEAGLTRAHHVTRTALAAGLPVRAYLSTAFGCPFEGDVPVTRVAALARTLCEAGAHEVAVSDTIGVAHPGAVRRMLDELLKTIPAERIALHFHDTWGMATANVLAALEYGIRTFDASAGGLGGCPYAPGASGNLATEDLLYLLHGIGRTTGVDLDRVFAASASLEQVIGHTLPSRYVTARSASQRRERA